MLLFINGIRADQGNSLAANRPLEIYHCVPYCRASSADAVGNENANCACPVSLARPRMTDLPPREAVSPRDANAYY